MPPYMYWPSDEAKIVYRRSAFKNRVLKTDILDVLSLGTYIPVATWAFEVYCFAASVSAKYADNAG